MAAWKADTLLTGTEPTDMYASPDKLASAVETKALGMSLAGVAPGPRAARLHGLFVPAGGMPSPKGVASPNIPSAAAKEPQMDETPHLRWFEKFPRCWGCGKSSSGILRGDTNQSYGYYCTKCAALRLKRSAIIRAKAKGAAA